MLLNPVISSYDEGTGQHKIKIFIALTHLSEQKAQDMIIKIFKQLFDDMNAAMRTLGDQSTPCELENVQQYDSCYQILDPIKKVVIERQIIPLH